MVLLLPYGSNPEGSLITTPVTTAALGYIQFPEVLGSLWSVLRSKRWHGLLLRKSPAAGRLCHHCACLRAVQTAPALDLNDPCRGGLILPVWEGRIILPRSGQHTCQSTNVYKWFFFPQLYLSLGFFSLTSRTYPCCALLFFPCRVAPHLTTSNSLYSCLDLAASALLNFYINDITEELIFFDFKIL